jgi:hypothetical protein
LQEIDIDDDYSSHWCLPFIHLDDGIIMAAEAAAAPPTRFMEMETRRL